MFQPSKSTSSLTEWLSYYWLTVGRTGVQVPGGGMRGIWLWLKQGQRSTAFTLACCLRGWGALWRAVPVTVLSLPCSQFTEAEVKVEIRSRSVPFYRSAVSSKLFLCNGWHQIWGFQQFWCLFIAWSQCDEVSGRELAGELHDKIQEMIKSREKINSLLLCPSVNVHVCLSAI